MTLVRLCLALAAALLLALPTASAGSAEGRLEAASVHVDGVSSFEAPTLDLVSQGDAIPTFSLQAQRVEVYRIGTSQTRVGGPVPQLGGELNSNEIDESGAFENAVLSLRLGTGAQLVALKTDGPANGQVTDAHVRPVAGVQYARASDAGFGAGGGAVAQRCVEATGASDRCLDAFGVQEVVTSASSVSVTGTLRMLLYGPALDVVANGATTAYASGISSAQATGPVEQTDDAWVIVRAEGVTGTISGDAIAYYTSQPALGAPAATFDGASGAVRVGLREYRAHGESVATTGALTLVFDAPFAGSEYGAQDADGRPTAAYGELLTARVTGDVQTISLQAAPVYADSAGATTGAIAALLAVAGGAAYYWPRLAFGAASLYTRLKKPDILDNDVRNRVYDIIRDNPGISAREVHRRSEQSWGTVVYHLRQLERHHLVVSRALGRTRNYYENHGKYKGMEAQLACLQSDRALALARAIVAQPGITQEALSEVSGFPQPTTSYYVRKLKQAGLVEERREGRYARYLPHADLPRYISISETPRLGQNASSGVQA